MTPSSTQLQDLRTDVGRLRHGADSARRILLRRRHVIASGILLFAGSGLLACGEIAGTAAVAPEPVQPLFADMSPQQQRFMAQALAAEPIPERPATQQELQAFRDRFPPGQLELLLTILNRRAAARGEDTIPHCVPLCGQDPAPGQ